MQWTLFSGLQSASTLALLLSTTSAPSSIPWRIGVTAVHPLYIWAGRQALELVLTAVAVLSTRLIAHACHQKDKPSTLPLPIAFSGARARTARAQHTLSDPGRSTCCFDRARSYKQQHRGRTTASAHRGRKCRQTLGVMCSTMELLPIRRRLNACRKESGTSSRLKSIHQETRCSQSTIFYSVSALFLHQITGLCYVRVIGLRFQNQRFN